MNALTAAGWTVRVTGTVMLVLGLLIWANVARALVPLHMLIGVALVIALWATAVLALRAGVRPVLPIVAVGWGVLMFVFGMTQAQVLPRQRPRRRGDRPPARRDRGHRPGRGARRRGAAGRGRDGLTHRRESRRPGEVRGRRSGRSSRCAGRGPPARGYSPMTLQSSPIMMKKPLNMAIRATEP